MLLVTCGDPAGIGPEVVLGAWRTRLLHEHARLRLVADASLIREAGGVSIAADDERPSTPEQLLAIEVAGSEAAAAVPPGRPSAEGGEAAARAVLHAAGLVLEGRADGLVTGPLNKAALNAAGYDVPGHTELLARKCGLRDDAASMMLHLPPGPELASNGGLSVVHATLHESLRSAIERLSTTSIHAAGRRLAAFLEALLGRPGRIAVAALNPHAGESGLFGDEERRLVQPAVEAMLADGIDAAGPVPADTLFLKCRLGHFDGVVALYHDQGHIPVKLLGMHRAVNITLGLPLIRTSVAHGTAYDIVGTGTADPSSMVSAIRVATLLAKARPIRWDAFAAMGSTATAGADAPSRQNCR